MHPTLISKNPVYKVPAMQQAQPMSPEKFILFIFAFSAVLLVIGFLLISLVSALFNENLGLFQLFSESSDTTNPWNNFWENIFP